MASHDPETPGKVAQLIEAYDSAHSRQVPANELTKKLTKGQGVITRIPSTMQRNTRQEFLSPEGIH